MEEFKTGDKVIVSKVGKDHLFDYVGKHGKIVSSIVMSVGAPIKYKVLLNIQGIEETAYFLKNEIVKIKE